MFDRAPAEPLAGSVEWMTGTLFGDLAAAICVIAIAFVGLTMLTGRLAIRDGARVILGCFVLLGAPVIAAGLSGLWQADAESREGAQEQANDGIEARGELEPVDDNPYAGAIFRPDIR